MTTVDELVQRLVAAFFRMAAPGSSADSFAAMAMPLLRKITNNDVAWDSVITSDATAEGIYQLSLQRRKARLESLMTSDFSMRMTRDAMRDWEMTKQSEEDWTKTQRDAGVKVLPGDYERYITRRVDSDMANKFWTIAYGKANEWLNLDGTGQAAAYLGMMTANFAQTGMYRNDRNAFTYARFMAEDLFNVAQSRYDQETGEWLGYEFEERGRDEEGNIVPGKIKTEYRPFNREDWAGFSKESVTGLGANLSANMDLLRAINPDDPYQLSMASERFKDTLHQYLEALRPLRDAFGDDMPKIISTIEGMTQMSLAQVGSQRASIMAQQMSAVFLSGRYSDRDWGKSTMAVQARLNEIEGLGSLNYINAAGVSKMGLDFALGGSAVPNYRTKPDWTAHAIDTAFSVANSEAADQFDMAYSIWANNLEKATPLNQLDTLDTSTARFQQEVMRIAKEQDVDLREAARRLAGVNTYTELYSGIGYGYYATAKNSQSGAWLAMKGMADQSTETAIQTAIMDESLAIALQGAHVNMPTDLESLTNFADAVRNNADVLFMNNAAAAAYLEQVGIKDKDGKVIQDQQALRGLVELMRVDTSKYLADKTTTDDIIKQLYKDNGNLPADADTMIAMLDAYRANPGAFTLDADSAFAMLTANGNFKTQDEQKLRQVFNSVRANMGRFMVASKQMAGTMASNNNAPEDGPTPEWAMEKALQLVEQRPEFLGMDEQAIITQLMNTPDPENGGYMDLQGAKAIATVYNFAKHGRRGNIYQKALEARAMQANQADIQNFEAEAQRRRTVYRDYENAVFTGKGGLFQLFHNGFSMERLKQALTASNLINNAEQDGMVDLLAAGAMIADETIGMDADGSQTSRVNFVKGLVTFANDVKGLSSLGFNRAKREFKEARELGNKDEMLRQASLMATYKEFDAATVDRYLAQNVYNESGERVTNAEEARKIRLERLLKVRREGGSIADFMARESADSQVYSLDDERAKLANDMYNKFRAGQEDLDKNGTIENYEGWDEFYKAERERIGSKEHNGLEMNALDALKDIMQSSHQGIKANDTIGDIMTKVTETAERTAENGGGVMGFIQELLAQMAPLLSKQLEVLGKLSDTLDKRSTDNNDTLYGQPAMATQD